MSDANRKDLHDSMFHRSSSTPACSLILTLATEVADHVTPDNSKSTTEKVKDTVTGTADKVQRYVISHNPLIHRHFSDPLSS